MAVPFRRTSKTAKRKRRTHFKLSVPGMVTCPNCGEAKLSHRVCKACGQYKGKEVAGSETLGACRVGNRTRKSTVATFIVANDENYGAEYKLAA